MPPLVCRLGQLALVAVFAAGVSLPGLAGLLGPSREVFEDEARKPAPFPPLALSSLALNEFPGRFEAFVNDHLGLRDWLLAAHRLLAFDLLRTSPTPRVDLGRHRWLYLNEAAMYRELGITAQPPADEQLRRWRDVLEDRRCFLAELGGRLVVLPVPEKSAVYPEYLPRRLSHPSGPDAADGLAGSVPGVCVLDLRPALLACKQSARAYHVDDTHWTYEGAFAAYRVVAPALARGPADPAPLDWADLVPHGYRWPVGGDLARMAGLAYLYPREQHLLLLPRRPASARVECPLRYTDGLVPPGEFPPETWARRDGRGPSGVVFRDSFGIVLYPFLAEHFRTVTFMATAEFDPLLLDDRRPELVVCELAERMLRWRSAADVPGVRGYRYRLGFAAGRPLADLGATAPVTWGPVRVDRAPGGWQVESADEDAFVGLPIPAFAADEVPIVRVELTSPAEGEFRFLYRPVSTRGLTMPLCARRLLHPGRNELFIPLPDADPNGHWAFQARPAPGGYVLHALEVRAVPR